MSSGGARARARPATCSGRAAHDARRDRRRARAPPGAAAPARSPARRSAAAMASSARWRVGQALARLRPVAPRPRPQRRLRPRALRRQQQRQRARRASSSTRPPSTARGRRGRRAVAPRARAAARRRRARTPRPGRSPRRRRRGGRTGTTSTEPDADAVRAQVVERPAQRAGRRERLDLDDGRRHRQSTIVSAGDGPAPRRGDRLRGPPVLALDPARFYVSGIGAVVIVGIVLGPRRVDRGRRDRRSSGSSRRVARRLPQAVATHYVVTTQRLRIRARDPRQEHPADPHRPRAERQHRPDACLDGSSASARSTSTPPAPTTATSPSRDRGPARGRRGRRRDAPSAEHPAPAAASAHRRGPGTATAVPLQARRAAPARPTGGRLAATRPVE